MTNEEKLRETFPNTIFIFRKNGNDETTAIMISDEWLQGDYDQMLKDSAPCEDTVSRKHLLSEIDDLMKSPWFNRYKDDNGALHFGYTERKEAVEIVRDLCVKEEPPVTPKLKWIPVDYDRYPETYPMAFQEVWMTDMYGKVYHRAYDGRRNIKAWKPYVMPEPYKEGGNK